jgi:perosamine synthetase
MVPPKINRRRFVRTTATAGAGLSLVHVLGASDSNPASSRSKPAILGGPKAHPESWPKWPVFDQTEQQGLSETLNTGHWFRYYKGAEQVASFEAAFAKRAGAKYCLATTSGTTAMQTALGALDIGPGDEVVIPAYTFIAVYNVVVLNYALPIFADIDPETFQLDAAKMEAAMTEHTKAVIPVYIGGHMPDMDRVMQAANQRNVAVIEDACQATVSEWRGRPVGNAGLCGCFSFQAGKCLAAGEGGAILTNNLEFAHRCELFHNQGKARKTAVAEANAFTAGNRGTNVRMSEWHGAVLRAQMTRLEQQANRRWENGRYLNQLLQEIPGIAPARLLSGCTRSAFYLYMFRYQKEQFAGLAREKFLKALVQEGVPASAGFNSLNTDSYVTTLRQNRHYLKLYSKETLDRWESQDQCPLSDRLCAEIVCLPQSALLGSKTDMERVADAVRKIRAYAPELAKA